MLLTVGATQLITTDFVLAACVGLAALGFVEARFGDGNRPWWMRLMWLGLALAFMTKGPPALVVLLPFVAFDLLTPGRQRPMLWQPSGLALFAIVALPWYVLVILKTPGLLGYFVGDEVVNRLASDEFGRHGEWYGWLQVYAPTLLLGTLPWTPARLRWARGLPPAASAWRQREVRATQPPATVDAPGALGAAAAGGVLHLQVAHAAICPAAVPAAGHHRGTATHCRGGAACRAGNGSRCGRCC